VNKGPLRRRTYEGIAAQIFADQTVRDYMPVHSLISDSWVEEKRSRSTLALIARFDFLSAETLIPAAMGGLYVQQVFELVW
jgi:hypothetical protein